MSDDPRGSQQPEFWRDEISDDRKQIRRMILRWGLVFVVVLVGIMFAIWWAGEALKFSTSRLDESTVARYKITGVVRNAATGEPIPFASIEDGPDGRPPLFGATADLHGSYILMTIAEPHTIQISALGYKAAEQRIGKIWYRWFPYGSEQLNFALQPEP